MFWWTYEYRHLNRKIRAVRRFVISHFVYSFWVERRCSSQFGPSTCSRCRCTGSCPADGSTTCVYARTHTERVVHHSVVFQTTLRLHSSSQTLSPLKILVEELTCWLNLKTKSIDISENSLVSYNTIYRSHCHMEISWEGFLFLQTWLAFFHTALK